MHEIDDFKNYLETSAVREDEPDHSKARGMMEMAFSDMERVREEKISEESASYVFKNAYDVIRTSVTALMASDGYHPYSHTAVVAYARDELSVPSSEASKLNKFRNLRNNIQYRASRVTKKEAEEIVEFMDNFVPKIGERLERGE